MKVLAINSHGICNVGNFIQCRCNALGPLNFICDCPCSLMELKNLDLRSRTFQAWAIHDRILIFLFPFKEKLKRWTILQNKRVNQELAKAVKGNALGYILRHLSQIPVCKNAHSHSEYDMLQKEISSITNENKLFLIHSKYQIQNIMLWIQQFSLKKYYP